MECFEVSIPVTAVHALQIMAHSEEEAIEKYKEIIKKDFSSLDTIDNIYSVKIDEQDNFGIMEKSEPKASLVDY